MTYLLKVREEIVQTETLRVFFGRNHRVKRVIDSPIGPMREIEDAGVEKSRITIRADHLALNARGRKAVRVEVYERRISESKQIVRRLAAKDEDALAHVDARLDAARAALRAVEDQRAVLVTAAWRRATPVLSATLANIATKQATERARVAR